MALQLRKAGGGNTKAVSRGKLPDKRTINLATAGVETMNMKAATAGIILIVAAAVLFSKFAVADRLIEISRAGRRVSELQSRLDDAYGIIGSYSGLEDDYAHYTYSGMTEEELSLVERADVIEMLDKELAGREESSSWTLSGNILTVTVTGDNLQELNMIARNLESYDLVSMCSVSTAVKQEREIAGNRQDPDAGKVRANIIAYLSESGEGETA